MCYYDYCAVVVAVEVDEKRKNIVSCRNVKVACRLIAKKNRGVVDKRSCDSYTLLLTARQIAVAAVGNAGYAEKLYVCLLYTSPSPRD